VAPIDGDDVVQQVASTAFNPRLRDTVLSRTAERGLKAIERIAIGTSTPYLPSRSKMRNLGAH